MALIDKQLILSDCQHINYVGVETVHYYPSDYYLDLGPLGIDPGVYNPTGTPPNTYETYPGWHELTDKLFFHMNTCGTPGGTAPINKRALTVRLMGATQISAIIATNSGWTDQNYIYYIATMSTAVQEIHYQRVIDITLPRFYHRYLYMSYEAPWDIDIKLRTWIDGTDDFNAVRRGFFKTLIYSQQS